MSKTATLSVSAAAGAGAAAAGEFDVPGFEQRLRDLKDTQDSIQQLSAWCLQRRAHHKKIVNSWLNVLKQVKVESRLTLFYLANDVIQYSKRKNYEYVDSWGTYLQKATTLVRDEKVKHKILRIFKIWEQREVYNDEFLADLNGLLSATTSSSAAAAAAAAKKSQESTERTGNSTSSSSGAMLATGPTRLAETKQAVAAAAAVIVLDIEDFQTASLVSTVKECVKNENDTDTTFKSLNKTPFVDVEAVKSSIKGKDRKSVEDIEREIEENLVHYQSYVHSLKTELKSRRMLISLLEQAETFYHSQRGEVKVVANAYRNFGNRLKSMKKKLDELTTTLPSPIPSPDINAPSPEPDMDLQLPDEQSYFNMNGMMNSSYMDGNLPFDISDFRRESSSNTVQPIQVINSRKEESEGVNDFLKSFFPDTPGRNYPLSGGRPPAQQQQPNTPQRPSAGGFGPSSNASMDDYGGGGGPADYTAGLNSYGVPSNVVGGGTDYGLPGLGARPNNHHPGAGMGMNRNYGGGGPQYNQPMLSDYSGGRGPPPGGRGPLLPPPAPPVNLDRSDEYNSTWDMSMTWDGPHDSSGFQGLDTPVSPPHYERKGDRNTNVIEYIDGVNEDGPLQDVDHRQLPNMAQLPPAFMKEKGRLMDVDHRNLISLTGSPGPLLSNKSALDDLENVDDDDEDDILLTGNRHKGGDSKSSAKQPTPVPAPVSPVVNTASSSSYWANSGDVDLRFGIPPVAATAAASVTVPTTTTTAPSTLCSNSNSSIATNATSESKDLDMRIQSMQKTLDSHFGEVGSIGGDSKSGDDVPSGLQSLQLLQTPASLLEIDDFLQNFERENFDMSKPPSQLMSNQETDLSPSPSPPSLTSSLSNVAASTPRRGPPAQPQRPSSHDDASDEHRKPADNNESVDMDLSEPEESLELDQMAASAAHNSSSGKSGTKPAPSTTSTISSSIAKPSVVVSSSPSSSSSAHKRTDNGNNALGAKPSATSSDDTTNDSLSELQECGGGGVGDIYEDSAEPYEPFEGEDPDEPVPEFPDEAEMGMAQQNQQHQQPPPLMAEPIQRPPLLPDPAGFPPHFAFQAQQQQQQQQQRNQWDLPPPMPPQMNNFGGTPGIPSLTDLANFGEFPSLAAGLSNMGSPPGMPPHVWNNQFNSPNRGPPPGGFGGSPFNGGGNRGNNNNNFRNNQWQGGPRDGGGGGGPRHGSPYFRGGGGRGNFRGGKFRGGGGHHNNNNRGGNWLDSFIRNGGDVLQLITQFAPTLEQLNKK